jgi:phage replication O-like protein O
MASPQIEEGYTPIANEIAEALMKINLSAYESRVLWFLFRKTYGWGKKTDWISLSQFSKCIGIDRRLVHRAVKSLSSKKMIVIERDDGIRIRYGFQKDYDKWKVSSKKMTVIKGDDLLSSKEIPTKETITKEKRILQYFDAFWTVYPKKKNRGDAEKAWSKIKFGDGLLNKILTTIEKATKSSDWKKDNGQFIPYPASWLNAKGWEDEFKEDVW